MLYGIRSEERFSRNAETDLVCRLLLEKKKYTYNTEKAKELLSYGDVPLADIAYRLGYSSTAFLSRQFKQETGMTPTEYQRSQHEPRAMNEI